MFLARMNELHEGVQEIESDGHRFFVYRAGETIRVYDGVCPHQGARLYCNNVRGSTEVYCKVHDWRFCARSGISHNIQNAKLFEYEISVDGDGNIWIQNYKDVQDVSSVEGQTQDIENVPPPSIVMKPQRHNYRVIVIRKRA